MGFLALPTDLVDMLRSRRVIPFLGSGFSAPFKLPDWDTLLSKIATEMEDDLPYAQVKKFCNADPLQIAEYYFIKSDRSIGPIRHAISRQLDSDTDPLSSGAHVEMANLGAPQIYTTNYDDLIELTFKRLHQPVEVIALPKHVATALGAKTQVIKYHGDLKHEATLVLTESSYYARLDFESPMDLKFRSDLLGRSVLFVGYSFRDINIRVIWFKLMRMMKDIRSEDRPTSYIVRFSPNAVLEKLYEEVGIKSIVLDPTGSAKEPQDRCRLLSDFMFTLASQASPDGVIPGSNARQFFSHALIENLNSEVDKIEKPTASGIIRRRLLPSGIAPMERLLSIASLRSITQELASPVATLLHRLTHIGSLAGSHSLLTLVSNYVDTFGAASFATFAVAVGLCRRLSRQQLLSDERDQDWESIWGAQISPEDAAHLIRILENETEHQGEFEEPDYDIAFAADVVKRIAIGQIFDSLNIEIVKQAEASLARAAKNYPSIAAHSPAPDRAPDVSAIMSEISKAYPSTSVPDEDEIPF
jgi:hypothetical protein